MATWCVACKRELPQLQRLRALFEEGLVDMLGVPVDDKETLEKLSAYVAQYEPAYELLTDLTREEVTEIQALVKESLKLDGLPATIVTDGDGYVLRTMWGVPSVSQIRKLLANSVQ